MTANVLDGSGLLASVAPVRTELMAEGLQLLYPRGCSPL